MWPYELRYSEAVYNHVSTESQNFCVQNQILDYTIKLKDIKANVQSANKEKPDRDFTYIIHSGHIVTYQYTITFI